MDQETSKLVNDLPINTLNTLEISGGKWKDLDFKSYQNLQFPEFDVCEEKTEATFDMIIAEQVFEHLKYPYRASKNVYEMLNKNGYLLLTIPFLIKIHDVPIDCTRWTETGIKYFLNEAGFDLDKIKTGAWGNRACVAANFDCWENYNKRKHSLKNEEEFPLVVWVLAQK